MSLTRPPLSPREGSPGNDPEYVTELLRLHDAGQLSGLDEFYARYPESQRADVRRQCERILGILGLFEQYRSLTPGQVLASYEVLELIARGGMGEVYRARDSKLGREVAIKVLPQRFIHDKERLARFQREARVLATLNHPNIAAIYGLEESETVPFLVLELVEGETLAERIARGPMRLEETARVCHQIAEALEAAHEQGLIHRDLKPANVKINAEGRVKLLDFGLARQFRMPDTEGPSAPSITADFRRSGAVLGTAPYMSPEQVRGESVDRRTDIWSFGCVLYECLTGRRAIQGKTAAEVFGSILTSEPDWKLLASRIPPHVTSLIRRTLREDPRRRLRDIGDARLELEDLLSGRAPEHPTTRPGPTRRTWAATVLGALGAGALARHFWRPTPGRSPWERPWVVGRQLTDDAGMEGTPALSPDGQALAFTRWVKGRRQVFTRMMEPGARPIQITDGEDADYSFPRWIDNARLIYLRQPVEDNVPNTLYEDLRTGKSRKPIGTAQGETDVSPQGTEPTLATFREAAGRKELVLMDGDGREIGALKMPEGGRYASPRWSPNGRDIAFHVDLGFVSGGIQVMRQVREQVERGAEAVTEPVVSSVQIRGLSWLPDGSGLVYASSEGSTLVYPPTFSLRIRKLDGSGGALPLGQAGDTSFIDPDVRRDPSNDTGVRLVTSRVRMKSDIWRFPVPEGNGNTIGFEDADNITQQTSQVQTPSVSPDGTEVAYLSDRGGHSNVWVSAVDGSDLRKITFEKDPSVAIGIPRWSPTDDRIVYIRAPFGMGGEEWMVNSRGGEKRKLVAASVGGAHWSRDGKELYFFRGPPLNSRVSPTTYKIRFDDEGGDEIPVLEGAAGFLPTSDENIGYYSPSTDLQGQVWRVDLETDHRTPLRLDLQPRVPMFPHHYTLSADEQWLATPLKDGPTTNLYKISTEEPYDLIPITSFGDRSIVIGRQVSWWRDDKRNDYIFAAVLETGADIVLLNGPLG